MRIVIIAFFLLSSSIGVCVGSDVEKVSYRAMLNLNAQNIRQVKEGMTIPSVVSLMKNYQSRVRNGVLSNPWKIEAKGNTEIYHYLTRRHPPFTSILEQQATPIMFIDGKVSAIGRQFLKDTRSSAISPESSKPASEGTLEERLMKIKDLYNKGIIDQQEYDKQKQRILNSI